MDSNIEKAKKYVCELMATTGQRKQMEEKLKETYIPSPCEICGKPMSYEEAIQMHMFCSVNPKDKFCGETVFCCDSHTGQERHVFVMEKRKKKKALEQ